jgi:hypothetical protein
MPASTFLSEFLPVRLWSKVCGSRSWKAQGSRKTDIPPTAPSSPNRIEKLLAGLDVAKMRGIEIAPLSRATVKKSEGDIIYVDRLTHEELLLAHRGASYITPSDILPVDVVLGERSIAEAFSDSPKFD